jgi:hypothetical protein
MRRQLAVNSNTSAQDLESIQTVELLGEGTFGKVRARCCARVCVWRACVWGVCLARVFGACVWLVG